MPARIAPTEAPHPSEVAEVLHLMLCGWYHAISFTARATRLAPEPGTPAFDDFLPPAPPKP
ncbi:hypothetical protein [Streptomyces platensis]|uniref:hypothetical protein n=1 Tax=Streptomyces platensis TaxID=58346 RepID=UPI0036BDE1CA